MALHGLIFLLCALYGLVFVLGKLTLLYAPPIFITGARMTLAGILLLAYQYRYQQASFTFNKKHLWALLGVGITSVYLTNIFEFWGLQYLTAGKACFIYSFCPIVTAFLSYWVYHEKMTYVKCIGLAIGILGFVPVLMAGADVQDISARLGCFSYAELAILIAAVTTSVGWILMRIVVKRHAVCTVVSNGFSMLMGGIIALMHSAITESWTPTPITDLYPFLLWFFLLTLVSNLICYNLHAYLLRIYTATYISFTGLTQPFFAATFGWLFLQEVMNSSFWISVLAVSIGLCLYYREELKQGY
jgi:drug/metabolite transporter (DMT)-like permease